MESTNEELRELTLLEKIENDPDVNQSTLATQLGVAVGTVNWHLKRLIAKGYVKVKRAERKKLQAALTQARGNRSQAAKLLGISRSTFYERLKRYVPDSEL